MLITGNINTLPSPNLAPTRINFFQLFTKREKPLLIEMGALAFGASVVVGLALAGVTVLLAPEILTTACIVGGIALFILGIKVPPKIILNLKARSLERIVARVVKVTKQGNVNLDIFNTVHSLIIKFNLKISDSPAQDKLKQLISVLSIFKSIAKAQIYLKKTGQFHLINRTLTQAIHELNNCQSIDATLKNELFTHIAAINNQLLLEIKNEINQMKLAGEASYKEMDAILTDTFGVSPISLAQLPNHLNQQRILFDILKCIKIGKNLINKSNNALNQQNKSTLTDTEIRRALIYLSDAEEEMNKPASQEFLALFLPEVIELKEKIKAIYSQHKLTRPDAAAVFQRVWRAHHRKKLLKNNQTYEDWRIQNANKKILRAIPAAEKRKAMYRDTHIVFTHGQSSQVSVLNDLIKALAKTFTPEKYRPYAPGFRIPELVPRADNAEEFFIRHPEDFVDDKINNELLSVDAYFHNHDPSESANYFYSKDSNISTSVLPRACSILQHYLAQANICNILAAKIERIATQKSSDRGGGVFHTICIPKVVVNDPKRSYVYRSHAYGKPCKCHPKEQDAKILDDLQKDIPHRCGATHPQYRLVTSAFSKDTTVRSFAFSNRTKTKEEEYRKAIENVAIELHVYARLINLTARPSEVELAALNRDIQMLITNPNFDQSILAPLLTQKQAFIQITP